MLLENCVKGHSVAGSVCAWHTVHVVLTWEPGIWSPWELAKLRLGGSMPSDDGMVNV